MADFIKILIANRGEIAIRIMRVANEMGKKTSSFLQKNINWDCTDLRQTKPTALAKDWDLLRPICRSMKSFLWTVNAVRILSAQIMDCCPKILRLSMPVTKMGSPLLDLRPKQCAHWGTKFPEEKLPLSPMSPLFPQLKCWSTTWTRLTRKQRKSAILRKNVLRIAIHKKGVKDSSPQIHRRYV